MKLRPVALLDACVLVPMPLADTLLRLAEPPAVFDARWSEDILTEMSRALVRRFAKVPAKARYRESAMRSFFPHALVADTVEGGSGKISSAAPDFASPICSAASFGPTMVDC